MLRSMKPVWWSICRLTLFQILAEYQSYYLLLLLAFQIYSVLN